MSFRTILNLAIGVLLLISLVSCNPVPNAKPTKDMPSPPTAKSPENPTPEADQNWMILTEEQGEEMGIASWFGGTEGLWTPSADDVVKLEERLPAYLSQNSSFFLTLPPAWERLDAYQRQYIGLVRGGRQIIYGNFFCDNLGIDWRESIVVVDDGGDCYFQFEYDLEDGDFIMLLVNGVS